VLAEVDRRPREVRGVARAVGNGLVGLRWTGRSCARTRRLSKVGGWRIADRAGLIVLRGPDRGTALTDGGERRIFQALTGPAGAARDAPHRLRHT